MLISRGLTTLKALNGLQKSASHCQPATRNMSAHAAWNYRCAPPPVSKRTVAVAEAVQAFAWWWVLWHMWTEPGHVFGEFDYPDPSQWSDAELGIPED